MSGNGPKGILVIPSGILRYSSCVKRKPWHSAIGSKSHWTVKSLMLLSEECVKSVLMLIRSFSPSQMDLSVSWTSTISFTCITLVKPCSTILFDLPGTLVSCPVTKLSSWVAEELWSWKGCRLLFSELKFHGTNSSAMNSRGQLFNGTLDNMKFA